MMQPFEIQQSDPSSSSSSSLRRKNRGQSNGFLRGYDDDNNNGSDDGRPDTVRKRTWSHEEEEGFEDAIGLISNKSVPDWDPFSGGGSTKSKRGHDYDVYGAHDDDGSSSSDNIFISLFQALRHMLWNADMKWWMFTIFLVFIWFVILPKIYVQDQLPYKVVEYKCDDPIKDIDYEEFDEDYIEPSKSLQGKNGTEIWNYMQGEYVDGYKTDYQAARKFKYDWKVKEFAPYLTNGSSIYESACGIGQNIAITLDILQEVKGITDIVVYGNELIEESATAAQVFFEEYQPFGAKLGRICPGIDSTNLSHVPSNSFDLVFTGYITPLPDPLDYESRIEAESTTKDKDIDKQIEQRYKTLCDNAGKLDVNSHKNATNPHEQAFEDVQKMQQIQEDWYSLWTSEMIRIARPGVPVIIEMVSYPLCVAPKSWGGVSRDFWTRALENYSWKIEKDSIHIDQFGESSRYFVAMKKQSDSA
jgi:hypothetical protein